MTLKIIKSHLKNYAKDIKLNLSNVLSEEGSPDLTLNQIAAIALSSAYATKNHQLVQYLLDEFSSLLSDAEKEAARIAATLMAMNNIYYRFIHLVSDSEYQKMPAKLRMNAMGNPGVPKIDFEYYSLAVSALNGCGMCMDSHASTLEKSGARKESIQSVVRIAAVISAVAQAFAIKESNL